MTFSRRRTPHLLAVLCGLLLAMPAPGQQWAAPSVELAKRIAAICGPGTVVLTVRTLSSVSGEQLPLVRRALVDSLASQGIIVRESEAATAVHVTLSENAQHALWVAEVQQGTETRVAMLQLDEPAAPARATPTLAVSLRKTLLFADAEPLLDAQLILLPSDAPGTPHLVVLARERVTLLRRDAGSALGWSSEHVFDIPHMRPFPRDVRGRLQAGTHVAFVAYLPGVICTAAQPPDAERLSLVCSDSDDPWPLGVQKAVFNASRNVFTGVLMSTQSSEVEPFYSAAELAPGRVVFSLVSGRFALSEHGTTATLTGTRDWGSDLAAVQSACGAHLLLSAAGDAAADSLLAADVNGHAAIPVSAALPFAGQMTALWPALEDSSQAIAIVHDQQTATYEVYGVSLICN